MLELLHTASESIIGRTGIIVAAGVIASIVAIFAYGLDKFRAQKKAYRIPEATLHMLGIVGGWPGALFAQRYFRHKTSKMSFQIQYYITVVVHLLLSTAYIIVG